MQVYKEKAPVGQNDKMHSLKRKDYQKTILKPRSVLKMIRRLKRAHPDSEWNQGKAAFRAGYYIVKHLNSERKRPK